MKKGKEGVGEKTAELDAEKHKPQFNEMGNRAKRNDLDG